MRNTRTHRTSFPYSAVLALLALLLGSAAALAADAPPKDPPSEAERSPTGLITQRLYKGYGKALPDDNDFVMIHFTGWTPAGAKFVSTTESGNPEMVSLQKMSIGWQEGLRMMVKGEKRRMWIPTKLAPQRPGAGPRGDVIFDVELMAIFSIPALPPSGVNPPADAETTRYGVRTQLIRKGDGKETAASGAGALVSFTLWSDDGLVLDSTLIRNRPTMFLYGTVMEPFADVLKHMVVGEKRYLWIPAAIAAGQWVGRPEGGLIFEAELAGIVPPEALKDLPQRPQGAPPNGDR